MNFKQFGFLKNRLRLPFARSKVFVAYPLIICGIKRYMENAIIPIIVGGLNIAMKGKNETKQKEARIK